MASRILLISVNRCSVPDAVFPLGLAHIAAALKQAGHEVRWHDAQASPEPLKQALQEFRPHIAGVSVRNIDDVLIRKRETYFDGLNDLCGELKQAGCTVVLGGSGFSIFPKELMAFSGADYGIAGAGEAALVSLVEALEKSRDPATIPGLYCGTADPVPSQSPARHLAASGWQGSDRPESIVSFYLRSGGMLNVQTQRGCACACCYCTYPLIEGRAHVRQNADAIAEEFAAIERVGGKYAFIVDSVFNSSVRHVTDVCEAILRKGVKVTWGCFLRPQGLSSELMKLMGRAGLRHVEFGSDSFSDSVLNTYQKGFSFEDIVCSSELAHRSKIDYCHFLILGGPGETEETLSAGFENSRQLPGAVMMAVMGMRIYPGTWLHELALKERVVSPQTNLLTPHYYVAPGLSAEGIYQKLQAFGRGAPNWIIGDPDPGYATFVERLRKKGMHGPLWSYVSIIQRLWPAGRVELPGKHVVQT